MNTKYTIFILLIIISMLGIASAAEPFPHKTESIKLDIGTMTFEIPATYTAELGKNDTINIYSQRFPDAHATLSAVKDNDTILINDSSARSLWISLVKNLGGKELVYQSLIGNDALIGFGLITLEKGPISPINMTVAKNAPILAVAMHDSNGNKLTDYHIIMLAYNMEDMTSGYISSSAKLE